MSHEEYWTWLYNKWYQIQHGVLAHQPEALQVAVFVKSLPPYDIWLAQSSPKGSESPVDDSSSSCPTGDSPNLSDKAAELRSKVRAGIKKYMEHKISSWSAAANLDLWQLASDWAKGQSIYKALDMVPDSELVKWNTKHEVFV